jgi:hypothetical protein
MESYIAAEFDSVDFADLASGRVRDIQGVTETKVQKNQFADERDSRYSSNYPVISPFNYAPFMGSTQLYPLLSVDTWMNTYNSNYEPSRRIDAQLIVKTDSDTAARRVTNLLLSIGGRNVHAVKK